MPKRPRTCPRSSMPHYGPLRPYGGFGARWGVCPACGQNVKLNGRHEDEDAIWFFHHHVQYVDVPVCAECDKDVEEYREDYLCRDCRKDFQDSLDK